MPKFRESCTKVIRIAGYVSLTFMLGFLSLKFIGTYEDYVYYKRTDMADGPYIFRLGDSAFKAVDISSKKPGRKFNISETIYCLADTSSVLAAIENDLRVEFDPYGSHRVDSAYFNAEKIAAVSDIHGSYKHLVALLQNNRILDKKLNWNWGSGHLVVAGDILDKGPRMIDALWLIKKLERQAEEAGGKVHLLLGNHEIYVLTGDANFMPKKHMAISKRLFLSGDKLFGRDTELGRWLRTKNVVVRINDKLFAHAGLSEHMVEERLSINDLNRLTRDYIQSDHHMAEDDNTRRLYSLIFQKGPYQYGRYFKLTVGSFLSSLSFTQSDLSQKTLDKILNYYDCNQIVVGHKIVSEIKLMHGNKVIAINISLPRDDVIDEKPKGQMLLMEEDKFYRLTIDKQKERLL